MSDTEVLTSADWSLELRADLGAAVLSLSHGDHPVLRPSPRQTVSAMDTACFPMVPYANRIAHGRFRHEHRDWHIALNFGEHPHAIHGVGWQLPWQVTRRSPDSIALCLEYSGGEDWPWPFLAEQRIALDPGGASFVLSICNRADRAMPVGLGFHPAFPAAPTTRMRTTLGAVWLADDERLPTVRAATSHFADWQAGALVCRDTLLDNCYENWSRHLSLTTGDATTSLTADAGLDWLHVYVPPHSQYICAEPVSHMPDALNRMASDANTGIRLLGAGERHAVSMRIEWRPAVRNAG